MGFVYLGSSSDKGWTFSHDKGRDFAAKSLPYLRTSTEPDCDLTSEMASAVDKLVSGGSSLIVATSFSMRNVVVEKASEYPGVRFLTCSSGVAGPNYGSYFARMEQAYFLAGVAAAAQTKSKRLGFVGSLVTPEVVRHVNAFALGARSRDSAILVEIRWVGFWSGLNVNSSGKYAENELTEQLIATGCDVIAHNMDNGRVQETVEAWNTTRSATTPKVLSISNNNYEMCSLGPNTCMGGAYWNWGPLYARLFADIHRGTWDPSVIVDDQMRVDPSQSIANFTVNQDVADASLAPVIDEVRGRLSKPGAELDDFKGPFCSTGQRVPACVATGQKLTDAELRTMCWFVEGVVQKTDAADPASNDIAAQVPPECEVQQ